MRGILNLPLPLISNSAHKKIRLDKVDFYLLSSSCPYSLVSVPRNGYHHFPPGDPVRIWVDNGPELVSQTMAEWIKAHEVELVFIEQGKPA